MPPDFMVGQRYARLQTMDASETGPRDIRPLNTARSGLVRGLRVFATLLKVMVPAYVAVSVLKQTPLLDAASQAVEPVMSLLGLPPAAAVPLIVSFFVSLYAAIGAMESLHFSASQVTQLAVVMLIAHNLVVEIGIVARLRTRWYLIGLFRLGMGLGMGALMHYAFGFNTDPAAHATAAVPLQATSSGWEYWSAEALTLGVTLLKTFSIVVPLMVGVEFLRSGPWLDRLTEATVKPLRVFGFERESVLPFWAGLLLGIAYGAGLLLDAAERGNFGGRQAFLVSVFHGVAHAIVEDTLLFAALGASLFWLLVPRLLAACILTWLCAQLLARRPVAAPEAA